MVNATKEAVAFASRIGRYIIIGVEDNGKITGYVDYDIQSIMESMGRSVMI